MYSKNSQACVKLDTTSVLVLGLVLGVFNINIVLYFLPSNQRTGGSYKEENVFVEDIIRKCNLIQFVITFNLM